MQLKKLLKALRIFFLLALCLTASTWAYSQTKGETTVSLDNVTKFFAIVSTVLGLAVGALQLWMAAKLAKVKEEFNLAISLAKAEFQKALKLESELLENKIDRSIEKMQNKVANKEDITGIKELVSMGMENMKQQITLHTQAMKIEMLQQKTNSNGSS